MALSDGRPDDDVLALLARDWSRARSFELERLLRGAPFPTPLYVR